MNRYIIYFSLFLLLIISYSCGSAKLSTAEQQYDRGEYFAAATTYRKVYNKTSSTKERKLKGEIALKAARCYDKLNMSTRAVSSYQNALRYDPSDSTIVIDIARNLHKDGKYRDAQKFYIAYEARFGQTPASKNGLEGVRLAAQYKENKTRFIVKRAEILNQRRADFSPMIFNKDEGYIYTTSSNDKNLGSDKSDITGLKPSNIWISKKNEKGVWQKPEIVEGDVNSEFDEGTPAFSPDGNTMYFTRARKAPESPTSTEIFTATRSDAQWGSAKKFEITRDTLSVFAHPAVSPDGQWLYFVSDMPGGYGGKDLWRVSLTGDSKGIVDNLGDQINTGGDEMFPTFRPDGTLYFSSNGHPGMGGLDIFSAREDEWGFWHIENLGYPINSNADDFGMTFFDKEEEEGFFASNRNDGRGYDHIYSFLRPSIKVLIQGQVTDHDDEPIPNAIVRVVGRDGSNHKIVTRVDGSFETKIDRGTHYVMMAGAKGFLNDKEEFRSDPEEEDATYEVNFRLASITKPVLIENIFYDFDKATLRPESETALNELIAILNNNPTVRIELSAHTDMIGTEDYNQRLSQRRAKSVTDYLTANGISANRLVPVGYGLSKPKEVDKKINEKYPFLPLEQLLTPEFIETLQDEEKEIANQINRRTEFQVLDIDFGIE